MEKNERKLVRRESMWARRKSFRRAETDPSSSKSDKRKSRVDGPSEKGKARAVSEDDGQGTAGSMMMHPNWSSSQVSISVLPDRLQELPEWYNRELERSAMAAIQFRKRYPIHNPVGPRSYRNHHLIPPQRRQGSRPSSTFSPHFPPISASTGDHPGHTVSMPGPSRTPSGSPLPTPSSSQVQVNQVGLSSSKPRTRKISQGSPHDNVDLMDVSDPWGTNWHHQSPYDVGIRPDGTGAQASPGGEHSEASPTGEARPRLASVPMRHKTVHPSPLSQSTSAVHLTPPTDSEPMILRKLSKRRPSNPFSILPGGRDTTKSAPATPISPEPAPEMPRAQSRTENRPKRRISLRPSVSTTSVPTLAGSTLSAPAKKEKRGSMLMRFARRFSIIRKPASVPAPNPDPHRSTATPDAVEPNAVFTSEPESMVHDDHAGAGPDHDDNHDEPLSNAPQQHARETISPEDQPAPSAAPAQETIVQSSVNRDSMSVLEAPFTVGNLSIMNPDAPTPDNGTPVKVSGVALPTLEEKPATPVPVSEVHVVEESVRETTLAPHLFSKELPPEPALSVISPVSRDIPLPPVSRPSPLELNSPAFSANSAPTIPSPSELAYIASPGMPPQDEMPSIPSPTSTAAPLPPPRDGPPMSRSPPLITPANWVLEDSAVLRASVVANPPTPFTSQPPLPSVEPSRRSSPTRKPVTYTEVDMFASAARARQQSESPTKTSRDPSPVKGSRMSQERVVSPVFPPTSPLSPQSYTTALGDASREGSPTKLYRESERSGSPVKGPRDQSRGPSPTKVHRQPSRETSPTKVHRQPSREASPSKVHQESGLEGTRRHREDSPTKPSTHDKEANKVRRTETFRLVRSNSNGVVPIMNNAETIIANGEHWEVVVEPTLKTKRSKKDRSSKDLHDHEPSGSSRRESRRKEKERETSEEPDPVSPGRRESRRHASEREDERRSSKRDSKRRDKHRSDGDGEPRRISTRHSHSTEPRRSTLPDQFVHGSGHSTPDAVHHRTERRPSLSARPTSEVADVDPTPLRARDAYELERMWRGRSVALDAGVIMTPPSNQAPLPNMHMQGATAHVFGPHGSTHTNLTMQSPFGTSPAPAPQPNPPMLYKPIQAKAYAPATVPAPAPVLPARSSARPLRTPSRSPTKVSNGHTQSYFGADGRPLSNPLPDPPRPSSYKPKPTLTPPVDNASPGSREYWTKYAGLTAS